MSQKLMTLLPQSSASTLAAGSLAAAAHILRGMAVQPAYPQPSQPAYPQPPVRPAPPTESEIYQQVLARMQAAGAPVPQQAQQSLANKWAGPLPSLGNGESQARRSKWTDIPPMRQDSTCPACEGPITDHPIIESLGSDSKGRVVYSLCGNRQVRCLPQRAI